MVPLTNITIANLTTTTTGNIDVSKMALSANPRDPQSPNSYAHLYLVNESGAGLDFVPSLAAGEHTPLPANRDAVVRLPPGETTVNWTVSYVLPQVYNDVILVYFLAAGETVPRTGQTGGAQAGNQQRVVSIPLTPDMVESATTNPINGTDLVHIVTNLLAPTLASGFLFVYLFYLRLAVDTPAAGTIAGLNFKVLIEVRNASNVVIATATPITHGGVNIGQGAAGTGAVYPNHFVLEPHVAMPMECGSGPFVPFPAGSTGHIHVQCTGVTGNLVVETIISTDVDQTGNVAVPGSIGNYSANIGPY